MTGWRRATTFGPAGVETWDIRISDEGFEEWLAERDRLREEGYPDRPPDVDFETLRAWVPHPGEEDHPYFETHGPRPVDEPQFPVLTVSWVATDGSRIRLLVLGDEDGEFYAEVQSDVGVMFTRQYPKEMSPDAVWGDIETQLASLSDRIPDTATVRVTVYNDFLLVDAAIAEATADVERGFINPLPEGPIQ